MAMMGQHNPHAADELHMYITNHGDLHRQMHEPIIKNLMHKKARGIYDSAKAHQLYGYLATEGAKRYQKEHGSPSVPYHQIFNTATRSEVARRMRDTFEGEAKLGNYDHLIPKKYQGQPKPPGGQLMKANFASSPVPGGKRSDSNATNVYLRRRDGSLTKVDLDGSKADSAGKPERPWMDGPNPVRMSKAQFGIVDSIGGAAIDAVKGLGQATKAAMTPKPKPPVSTPSPAPNMSRPGGGVRRGTGGVGLDDAPGGTRAVKRFAAPGASPLMPAQSGPPDNQGMYDIHMGHAKRYMDLVNHHVKMGKVALSPQDRARHLREAKNAKIRADQHTKRAQRHADAHAAGLPTAAGQGEGHMRARFMGARKPSLTFQQVFAKHGYKYVGQSEGTGGEEHLYRHPRGHEISHWLGSDDDEREYKPHHAMDETVFHTMAGSDGNGPGDTDHVNPASLDRHLTKLHGFGGEKSYKVQKWPQSKGPRPGGPKQMDAGVSPKPSQGSHIGSTVAATRGRQNRQSLDASGQEPKGSGRLPGAHIPDPKRIRKANVDRRMARDAAAKKRAREAQLDYLQKLNGPGGGGHPMGGYRSHGF